IPNSAATRSNRATATSPQLSAPTTTRTAAMTSSCFMTLPPVLRRPLSGAEHVLTVVHICLRYSKINAQPQSHVSAATRTARNVTDRNNWRRNALGNARSRARRLCDRGEDSGLTVEEEDGA